MKVLYLQNVNIAGHLDQIRSSLLRVTLKSNFLRQIYCDRSTRLGIGYLLISLIYLLVSLKWSMVLLILGPLLLGYPHLVASYRFLQKPSLGLDLRYTTKAIFRFFAFLTVCSLGIRFVVPQFLKLPQLPYGTWEILLSALALAVVKIKLTSIFDLLVAILTLVFISAILILAQHDPLAFVGMALISHNWVAFGHWFFAAKDSKNKRVALFAIALFAMIHILMILGFFDVWISFPEIDFISTRSFEVQGWALAPWTSDPMMWNRMIVLYAFGLSVHYFIWLQAIPQCLDKKSIPNSFRNSLQQLRIDCGTKTARVLLILGAFVILGFWFHTALAGRIYFGLAMLHGWLEFVFLMMALSAFLLKGPVRFFKS